MRKMIRWKDNDYSNSNTLRPKIIATKAPIIKGTKVGRGLNNKVASDTRPIFVKIIKIRLIQLIFIEMIPQDSHNITDSPSLVNP